MNEEKPVPIGLSATQSTMSWAFCPIIQSTMSWAFCVHDVVDPNKYVPGFGQPLYPEGDPRAKELLDLTARMCPKAPALALGKAIVTQMRQTIGQHPTIDFALVILAAVLGLPPGTALALFALGRTIGWIGHAIEQYQLDQLIRPWAQYVGPQPLS